jgi:hypothetical protein
MKSYLIVTGALFGLIGLAHLVRLFSGEYPLSDLWFLCTNLVVSLIGLGFAGWALRLLRGLRAPSA